jgi:hypothetical protein
MINKRLLAVFFMLFGFLAFAEQNNNGYENLAWGDTPGKVRSLYPGIREVVYKDTKHGDFEYDYLPLQDEVAIGVKLYRQWASQGDIQARFFYFYNDQLFRVFVVYRSKYPGIEEKLLAGLIKKYGYPTDPGKRSYTEALRWWENYTRLMWQLDDTRIVALHFHVIEDTTYGGRPIKEPTRINYFNVSRRNEVSANVDKHRIDALSGGVDL